VTNPPDEISARSFVAFSEIAVPAAGRAQLDAAFADRLRAVDQWPGFRGLQVWADPADPGMLIMVSWWESHEFFAAYMGSADHRRSHARIPRGEHRPRARAFHRYEVIAE
jgi:heme-degrading monooxygenase HmoA